ncbi:hypothetical protein D3C73_430600 [compost metagenome]
MIDAVGGSQAFELERHLTLVVSRPNDAIGTQGIRGADHIDQIPATVTALPLPCVRVEKVAVQAVAGHLVIETQGVITGATGAGSSQLRMHPGHEIGFAQTEFCQLARGNAGDRTGRRVRQDVVTGLAIEVDRLVYFIEIEVSTQPRHLQWAIATGVDARRFIVVPEDGGHRRFLN